MDLGAFQRLIRIIDTYPNLPLADGFLFYFFRLNGLK